MDLNVIGTDRVRRAVQNQKTYDQNFHRFSLRMGGWIHNTHTYTHTDRQTLHRLHKERVLWGEETQ